MELTGSLLVNKVVTAGGLFDPAMLAALTERLRQMPGEEARKELAATSDGPAPTRWTLRGIRATFDWLQAYTLSGVWSLLQRCDYKLRPGREQQYSPDPEYSKKLDDLLNILQKMAAHPDKYVVLFLDEMTYRRWPTVGPTWSSTSDKTPKNEKEGNNQQQRLVGVLNPMTGQVICWQGYKVGRRQLIAFYQQIVDAYPDAERIYIPQDNWNVHKHPDVLEAVAQFPQIELVWLPTYSPWLNPIEKVWNWLKSDILKMHRMADQWDKLKQRVAQFLDQFVDGSDVLLERVGLKGDGRLAKAIQGA